MFTISKQSINAEVVLNGRYLTLMLINPDGRFLKAHNAILTNMKILAQLHLGKCNSANPDIILMEYFTTQGWTIHI